MTSDERLHAILFALSLRTKKLGMMEEAKAEEPSRLASAMDHEVNSAYKEILAIMEKEREL